MASHGWDRYGMAWSGQVWRGVVSMNAALKELPPARILDCSIEQYYEDPCDENVPSLSSTTAHIIENQSLLHAWTNHPRFKATNEDESMEAEDEDTKAKMNGKIIHRLILGKGEELVVVDADNWRTKVARQLRDEAKAAGKTPVLAPKLEELQTAAFHLIDGCRREGFEFTGQSEVPIQWYEAGAAGPVLCRSLIDHLFLNEGTAIDVKTIRNAHPEQIARYFVDHGYDIQQRAYTRAVESLEPASVGRVEFIFIFLELTAPFAVVPVVPEMAFREIGKRRWSRAVRKWESALATQRWPSYVSGLHTLVAPEYVVRRHLEDWSK